MGEQRRVGFELPAEVFQQLLRRYGELDTEEDDFWEMLRNYYKLSPVMGDSLICSIDFVEYISTYLGLDKPAWVYEQSTLTAKMQCMVIAGPTRGHVLLERLKELERERDEQEKKEQERHRQLEGMFHQDEATNEYDDDDTKRT